MSTRPLALRLAFLVAMFGALLGAFIELASENIDTEWPGVLAAAGRSLVYFSASAAVAWWSARKTPAWFRSALACLGGAMLLTAIEYVPQAVRSEFGSGWSEAFSPFMLARPVFFGVLVATGVGLMELACRAIGAMIGSVNLSSPIRD
jgi:hypothetical protein